MIGIFGNEDEDCRILSDQEAEGIEKTRILVSPDRYVDFINDVNWNRYSAMIVSADYMPTEKKPIQRDGITYNYLAFSIIDLIPYEKFSSKYRLRKLYHTINTY